MKTCKIEGCEERLWNDTMEYCHRCKAKLLHLPEGERTLVKKQHAFLEALFELMKELDEEHLLAIIDDSCMSEGCSCGGEDSYIVWQ